MPDALPALLRAERVQEKAAAVGFDFPTPVEAWGKVTEASAEVLAAETDDQLEDEIGDLLFAVVNYARLRGVVPETALRRTTAKFSRRFQSIEAPLGDDVTEAGLAEMDALWEAAKAAER